MTVDAAGNNIEAVGVALTGRAAIAPLSVTWPTPAEGKNPELVLGVGFRPLGLRTTDGAPEWTEEPDGDPLEFYEDGYSIPTGLANVECVMTLAQTDPLVDELRTGNTFDEHGHIIVDAGGNLTRYALYTEDVFKNGVIERRLSVVTVKSIASAKPERGAVRGHTVTFEAHRHALAGGGHYRKWLIRPGVEDEGEGGGGA